LAAIASEKQPPSGAADNADMTGHVLINWLFVECLRTYLHPWRASEVARTMFDDDRMRGRALVVARA